MLKVAAVAKALDCSETNVYALIATKQLKSHPAGAGGKGHRITQAELSRRTPYVHHPGNPALWR